jgi:long-chain fatty acid transport protein
MIERRTDMKTRFLFAIAGLGVLFLHHDAHAAGFALDVVSGRGTGMAAAQTAMVDDSSAIFYNPAGIARGKSLDAQLGVTLISPSFSYTDTAGKKSSMDFQVVPPVNAYVSGGVTKDLSVGVGLFTPYGLAIEWPSGWAGRNLMTRASLESFYVNPSVAYRFGPVRVGAGFQLVRATVNLQRDLRFGTQDGTSELGAGTWGAGANGGVQIDAIEKYLTIGAHYRSAVKLAFDGNAHFSNVPTELESLIHDQAASTSIVNPDQLAIGVASRPTDAIVVDVDVVWLGWGKFRSIDIAFPNDKSGGLAIHEPKRWSNAVNYHVGVEGTLSKSWKLRGGVLYDPSPSPASTLGPDLPDADRLNLAVGGTYQHESGFRVDAGYQLVTLFKHESTFAPFPGEYGGLVNILGLSVGYSIPEKKASEVVDPGLGLPMEPAAPAPSAPPPAPAAPPPAP